MPSVVDRYHDVRGLDDGVGLLLHREPEIVHGLIDRFLGGQSFQLLGQSWNTDALTQEVVDTLKASIDPRTAVLWGASVLTTVTTLRSRPKPRSTCSGSHGFAASYSAMQ